MLDKGGGRPLIYIVACESSGDHIGALLIEALKAETDGKSSFAGIGGEQMLDAGLDRLFDPKELALLGIFEVLPKAFLVLRRVATVLEDIKLRQPDVLVTIDSWGFTGRIHQQLAREGSAIPRLRYVAPQVWAWRPGRAKQLSRWIHHLLALLPFEPKYFRCYGLPTTWVGHPVVESGFDHGDGPSFRARHGIKASQTVIGLLPGSRRSEVLRLLPVFSETIVRLSQRYPDIHFVLPTVGAVAEVVSAEIKKWPVHGITLVTKNNERNDAFAALDVAIAASGTVSLELALALVPHVVAYQVNILSALVFRYLAKTTRVNLVNILLGRYSIPERLQSQCRASVLSDDIDVLLKNKSARAAQHAAFIEVRGKLSPSGKRPSHTAAGVIISLVGKPLR